METRKYTAIQHLNSQIFLSQHQVSVKKNFTCKKDYILIKKHILFNEDLKHQISKSR